MSDFIRLELGGQDPKAWNRVFSSLSKVIELAVHHLVTEVDAETRSEAADLANNLNNITADWARAQLGRPVIDNEVKLAEIAERFERIKMSRVREEIARVELDAKKLELWEKRLATAIKWLGFLSNCVVRDENDNMTIVLTSQQLSVLRTDLESLNIEGSRGVTATGSPGQASSPSETRAAKD